MRKITLITTGGRSASSAIASAATGMDVVGFHDVHMMPFFTNGKFDGGPMLFDYWKFIRFLDKETRHIVICGPIITVIPLDSWIKTIEDNFECEINVMMVDTDDIVESVGRAFPGEPNILEAALRARGKALTSMAEASVRYQEEHPLSLNIKKLINDINTEEHLVEEGINILIYLAGQFGITNQVDLYNFVVQMCYYRTNINPNFFRNFKKPNGEFWAFSEVQKHCESAGV